MKKANAKPSGELDQLTGYIDVEILANAGLPSILAIDEREQLFLGHRKKKHGWNTDQPIDLRTLAPTTPRGAINWILKVNAALAAAG